MTDIELLVLAALASNIALDQWKENWIDDDGAIKRGYRTKNHELWNPIDDDGDALRLAVNLVMTVRVSLNTVVVWAAGGNEITESYTEEKGSRINATRRAIVRAAAEIGASSC